MNHVSPPTPSRTDLLTALMLVALTFAVYWPARENGFVQFDDNLYVSDNEHVRQGLTVDSLRYAWTTLDLANWIPLTWMSYELDAALCGVDAAAFHRTDLCLHAANVLLLYWFLRITTSARGRAGVVAALFAVHPLHVESVAWIAERKDVLSTFWMLLALLCYVRFVRKCGWRPWLLTTLFFVLGLLSKPMLVTFPVLLLLVDVWPLQRVTWTWPQNSLAQLLRTWRPLVLEKLSWLGLSLAFGLATLETQRQRAFMIDAQVHPLSFRLANAAQSCVWYLAKTLLPTNLYAYYPLPVRTVDWTGAAIAAIVLAAITAAAWFGSRRQPAFAFGWAWFLLSLAPVLGIIQVGLAAHADRYAYVPHIGLLTALVWLVADGLEGFPYARALQAGLAGVFLLFFSELTWLQAGYWHDPRTLWAHALELDEANWFARYQAGIEALRAGEEDVALAHFERSKQLRPIDGEVNMILAMFYQRRERWDQAAVCYRRILQTEPDNAKALFNLAIAAQMLGRPDEAKAALLRCVALKLDDAFVRGQLGLIYLQEQKPELALQEFDAALERQPQNRVMLEQSAEALVQLKRYPAARARLEAALELAPGDVPLRLRLADVLELLGDPAAARRHYQRALEIDPENDDARRLLEKGSAGAIHKDAAPQ